MRLRSLAATLSLAFAAAPLQAQVPTPLGPVAPAGAFGALPAATFGGSGIPNNAVMIGGANGAVIGLTATQRYSSPAVTNDGAGTFYAGTGYSTGVLSTWNFDYYVNPGSTTGNIFKLFIDNDKGAGTVTLYAFTIGSAPFASNQDSSNLGYGGAPFSALDRGEYSFALYQYDAQGAVLDHVAMNVQVTPEPASLVLLGTGLLGIGGVVRRRRA